MWIAKNGDWDNSHTELTKYFIEKIKQQVDFEEIISNRHKTTCGFTLVKEIIDVTNLALKREKSINRLKSLLNEAVSVNLDSSIVNDYILTKYYKDIIEYYKTLNISKLDTSKDILNLLNRSQIHYRRLEIGYYDNIINEVNSIDFTSAEFNRNSSIVDAIIRCAVPYILHKGYSVTSISDIAYRQIKKPKGSTAPLRILKQFNSTLIHYEFAIKISKSKTELDILSNYFNTRNKTYAVSKFKDIKTKFIVIPACEEDDDFILLKNQTTDPHNYLRNLYEVCIKNQIIVKQKSDLSFLDDYFDRIWWRFDTGNHKFDKSDFDMDSLNVGKRKNTLVQTLSLTSKSYGFEFESGTEMPIISSISDSLYYYNLAIGSKSIENSLSLLWTSLETLLPYRLKDNDIANVQYFVSKSLSIGAIGRELNSFIERYRGCNWINEKCFEPFGIHTDVRNFSHSGFGFYFDFLSKCYEKGNDPFDLLKENSNLLCKHFCLLNDLYTGKNGEMVQHWINKIETSSEAISYQLDRIYLHRNQIVHSGKFINEYSNLWNHLEWYVGKLLAYAVIQYLILDNKEKFDKKDIFMSLEASIDNTLNLLKLNSDKKICEVKSIMNNVINEFWQFF